MVGFGGLAAPVSAAPLPAGHHKKVSVSAPTRLDWTFVITNQSVAEPPADWLGSYESKKQNYDLFVPPGSDPKKAHPAIIFVSPGSDPMGWKNWESICKQHGVFFASAYGAGNDCPPRRRIRIVLDVLDDLRRNYRIDPDRTYLSGFSGGGRIACAVGFALPEFIGGVAPICAGGELREEPWLRHRLIERLSVALVTGETDFNRGEVERYRGPMFKEMGIRTRVWVAPKLGHGVPGGAVLAEVFQWLEEGLKQRQDLAKRHSSSRAASDKVLSREESAKLLLAEARQRLQSRATLFSGLLQLQGCMIRWNGSASAAEARKLLEEYEGKKEKPWEADDIAEQRRFVLAQARGLDAYASGPLPPQYVKQRADMARRALELWELILKDGPDTRAGQEAKERIPALRKLLDGGKSKE